jgi:hypothetical protein
MGELARSDVEPDVEANYHVARVTASDDAWATFRQVAVAQGTPVSRYLGRLVGAEIERRKTRPVRRVSGKTEAIEDGLAALREFDLRSTSSTPSRAGWLARRPTVAGAGMTSALR